MKLRSRRFETHATVQARLRGLPSHGIVAIGECHTDLPLTAMPVLTAEQQIPHLVHKGDPGLLFWKIVGVRALPQTHAVVDAGGRASTFSAADAVGAPALARALGGDGAAWLRDLGIDGAGGSCMDTPESLFKLMLAGKWPFVDLPSSANFRRGCALASWRKCVPERPANPLAAAPILEVPLAVTTASSAPLAAP